MANRVIDGLLVPIFVGGHPAVDFCNTRAGWPTEDAPPWREYLVSLPAFAVWAREVGLLTRAEAAQSVRASRTSPGRARAVVRQAIDLRTDLCDVLVRPPAPQAWRRVAAEVVACAAQAELTLGADRVARWHVADDADPVRRPYLAVVRSVTELLTSPGAATVSACPMPDCGWMFANPTGRRRWCSMAMCGNRNKARRHAARARTA